MDRGLLPTPPHRTPRLPTPHRLPSPHRPPPPPTSVWFLLALGACVGAIVAGVVIPADNGVGKEGGDPCNSCLPGWELIPGLVVLGLLGEKWRWRRRWWWRDGDVAVAACL